MAGVLRGHRGRGLLLPVVGLALWEAGVRAGWIDPLFFPPPSDLARMAAHLVSSGDLPRAALATLFRAGLGFAPGAIAGVILGIIIGISHNVSRMVEPSLSAFYSMPKLVLLPIFLLIFGVGETARVALIGLGTFLAMAIQVYDGVRGLDPGYAELARNYGASPAAMLRKVYLPGVLPQIFTGTRITFGRALIIAMSVELVMGSPGLGSLIWLAGQTFSAERLYVGVAAAGLLGFISQLSLRALEKRLLPWRQG